jgi:TolA-binding protein
MKNYLLLFALFVMAVGCGQNPAEAQTNAATTSTDSISTLQKQQLAQLQILDQKIQQKGDSLLATEALEIASQFVEFYQENPQLEAAIPYLYKAAEINMSQPGRALYGIGYFAEIFEKHPDHPLAPHAVFLTGLTFDEVLGEKERAVEIYKAFIDKYPKHELVPEAVNLISLHQSAGDELDQVKGWLEKTKK